MERRAVNKPSGHHPRSDGRFSPVRSLFRNTETWRRGVLIQMKMFGRIGAESRKNMSNVIEHPAAALMTEVNAERVIADSPEAEALQNAIFAAVQAYCDYLDRHGLFYDFDRNLLRASGLHVTYDLIGTMEIVLKDGAIDRCYGNGEDPDPFGGGRNPTRPNKRCGR
jgi:hypothetical protein